MAIHKPIKRDLPGSIAELVQEINSPESFLGGPCLVVGKVYKEPDSGKLVRITSGQYLGYCGDGIGRISNFWYWEVVDEDHKPTGEKGHGYGWSSEPLEVQS